MQDQKKHIHSALKQELRQHLFNHHPQNSRAASSLLEFPKKLDNQEFIQPDLSSTMSMFQHYLLKVTKQSSSKMLTVPIYPIEQMIENTKIYNNNGGYVRFTNSISIVSIMRELIVSRLTCILGMTYQRPNEPPYHFVMKIVALGGSNTMTSYFDSIKPPYSEISKLQRCVRINPIAAFTKIPLHHVALEPSMAEILCYQSLFPENIIDSWLIRDSRSNILYFVSFQHQHEQIFSSLTKHYLLKENTEFVGKWMHALMAQLFFGVLGFLKSTHLFYHNDLKLDNIVLDRTTEQFMYLEILSPQPTRPNSKRSIFLKLPTFGQKISLIDFGWSWFFDIEKQLYLGSTFCLDYVNQENICMQPTIFSTDFIQLACALLKILNAPLKTTTTTKHMESNKLNIPNTAEWQTIQHYISTFCFNPITGKSLDNSQWGFDQYIGATHIDMNRNHHLSLKQFTLPYLISKQEFVNETTSPTCLKKSFVWFLTDDYELFAN